MEKLKPGESVVLTPTTNDGRSVIESEFPYQADVGIVGTCPIIWHRWSDDAVEAKSKAAKGSKSKKEDDIESYVYRNEEDEICVPGEYFRQTLIHAAKFRQDPRSPRKSAMDLFKAAVISLDELCTTGEKTWDYVDRRRVRVQQSAITRARPAQNTGWECRVRLQVILPEYVPPTILLATLNEAGRIIGLADNRPTYGRFQVTRFEAQAA